mgnify:FL=1
MGGISTHCINEKDLSFKKEVNVSLDEKPRKSTLDFIRQFARVYQAENKLDAELSGFVLN